MIKETVVVSRVVAKQTWVRSQHQSGCGQCTEKASCSTQLLAKYFTQHEITVDTDLLLAQGDKIIVAIDESLLIRGAFLCYIVPLLALFLGALLGVILVSFWNQFNHDLIVSMSAIAGFVCALLVITKWQLPLVAQQFAKPVVLRKLN